MDRNKNSIWFNATIRINCDINTIKKSLDNTGEHFKAIVSLMPGISSVELIEQGLTHVILKTNEGLMNRSNISLETGDHKITLRYDEEYKAGKTITARSNFTEEYTEVDSSISFRIIISDLKARGFVGFFYKNFGSKNIGNAFLSAYQKFFEQ